VGQRFIGFRKTVATVRVIVAAFTSRAPEFRGFWETLGRGSSSGKRHEFGEHAHTSYHLTTMQALAETKGSSATRLLKDSYGRTIRDLRVSLTDRCNFRCFYCLPHGEPPIAPKEQMLSYEEIEYVCEIFVELGIEKIRLTGGEPMMRQDIETIISKLAKLK
jgi:uncharacterized radical SAM superfamily Fe-S cluster-containing enzyme